MEEKLNNTPGAIVPPVSLARPNESVNIYEGSFDVRLGEQVISIQGRIYFDWFPNLAVKFDGALNGGMEMIALFDKAETFEIMVNSLLFGRAHFSNLTLGNNIDVNGRVVGPVVLGDRSIPVSKVTFGIPNLRAFHGSSVKLGDTGRATLVRARLTFEDEDYLIKIDMAHNFKELHKALAGTGGYAVLYGGSIEGRNGNLVHSNLKELLSSFTTFLTFLNGRRCAPTFLAGRYEEANVWTDYSSYYTESYKFVPTWPRDFHTDGIESLWQTWSTLMRDPANADFLTTVVHWYVEANSNAGRVEGSIVLTQTALELLYNWFVVEQRGIIAGNDSHNISAANKIRLLLSQLMTPYEIPAELKHLCQFQQGSKDLLDGPECFVRIRNAIVHSQEEKRKLLLSISPLARYEALQLGLWYVELALLMILRFNGSYSNRCRMKKWAGEGEEQVPWNTNK